MTGDNNNLLVKFVLLLAPFVLLAQKSVEEGSTYGHGNDSIYTIMREDPCSAGKEWIC